MNDFVELSLTFGIIKRKIIERELRLNKNRENVADGLAGQGNINKGIIKKIERTCYEAEDTIVKRL